MLQQMPFRVAVIVPLPGMSAKTRTSTNCWFLNSVSETRISSLAFFLIFAMIVAAETSSIMTAAPRRPAARRRGGLPPASRRCQSRFRPCPRRGSSGRCTRCRAYRAGYRRRHPRLAMVVAGFAHVRRSSARPHGEGEFSHGAGGWRRHGEAAGEQSCLSVGWGVILGDRSACPARSFPRPGVTSAGPFACERGHRSRPPLLVTLCDARACHARISDSSHPTNRGDSRTGFGKSPRAIIS